MQHIILAAFILLGIALICAPFLVNHESNFPASLEKGEETNNTSTSADASTEY